MKRPVTNKKRNFGKIAFLFITGVKRSKSQKVKMLSIWCEKIIGTSRRQGYGWQARNSRNEIVFN